MTTCVQGTRSSQEGQVTSFVQVPTSLIRSGIPSDELHVYLLLCDFAGRSSVCWPSDRTIGGLIGKSQDTASRVLGRLEARGLIRRQAVPKSDENPTGRVICTLLRVGQAAAPVRQHSPAPCGSAPANGIGVVAAPVRQDPDSKEKKQHPAGGGVARATAPPPAGDEDPEPPAASREEWDALDGVTQDEILAVVKAANPGRASFPQLLLPLCLVELAARAPAPRPTVPVPTEDPRDPAEPKAERPPGRPEPAGERPRGDVIPFTVPGAESRSRREAVGRAAAPRPTRFG